jgi:hypothetical protein
MSGRTPINITDDTVYDNVDDSDDQFNLLMNPTLLLLGYDTLNDDALAGAGQLRLRGDVTVDGVYLDYSVTLVNTAFAMQTGTVAIGQSASDTVTIRNIAGATWDLVNDAGITGAGSSQFVNLGLLETTTAYELINGDYYSADSVIDADFYNRGGTVDVQEGEISFTGAVERFVNGAITGSGTLQGDDVVLDGTTISVATATFKQARILGDVVVSSPDFDSDDLVLTAGSTLELSNSRASSENISGVGEMIFNGVSSLAGDAFAYGYNSISLSGGVTLINNGQTIFPAAYFGEGRFTYISISLDPGTGEQITIENEPGASLSIQGGIGITDSSGDSATLYNFGTFDGEGGSLSSYNAVELYPANVGLNVVNDGAMTTSDGFYFRDAVTGAGTIETGQGTTFDDLVSGGQTVEFSPSYPSDGFFVSPQYPTLTLNDVQQFSGLITGFDQNGATDDQLVVNTETWQYQDFVANSGGTGGSLMFTDGSAETAVSLAGSFDPHGFQGNVSGNQTTITYTS